MSVLKPAKLLTLRIGKMIGVLEALGRSQWRKNQLLILAYHGVSQDDEHEWDSDLYITQDHFRSRMQALKNYGCNVLPLAEALQRLWTKTLPSCSVVLTFDDGGCDFYRCAFPVLKEFGLPATVYLTSYYSQYNQPVFDVMCSYVLWKGRERELDMSSLLGGTVNFNLQSEVDRAEAVRSIRTYARREKFSAQQKDELLKHLAERLNIDYEAILAKRILHLLSAEELSELSSAGVDIQLHTHRHHAPKVRDAFTGELEENRRFISKFTKLPPDHFSYPHGLYDVCYDAWLAACDVASATTCEPGLATTECNRYKLPRLVDTSSLKMIELEGWISGFSKFLPRKAIRNAALIPPFYY
jgi:peptidoglycan/xylan/chitin deacetylase (PgdA/CDA1 family)